MAGESGTRQRQPSRLQRHAPASIQTNRSTKWNVAIPLLSPIASPPLSFGKASDIVNLRKDGHHHQASAGTDLKPNGVFKKWQSAPFCYESASLASFLRLDASRR